jgi:glycosyltransferase involved in cell wall biosynthesis
MPLPFRSTTPHPNPDMKTILVISHLRWNFVFQRPQHLLTRLAKHYRIVFVEEPMRTEGAAHLESTEVAPNLTVVRPKTPLDSAGFHDDQLAVVGALLDERLPSLAGSDYVVWFYTPMALPLLDRLAPSAVVYDCMDELSAFAGAPKELRDREAALLERADLVLTGGPSLYEAKRALNPRVLCLPSSVDAKHFAPGPHAADDPWTQRARALQGSIAGPRLGFFGVIDERMDLALIARLADADPDWSVVMVGPVVKIDPASLPQRPNLHWLGQQPYELLPRLIEGWQVGLLPFARNEATRFISPTKTLEYMAAGKPVVSTAIRDVTTLYGDVVRVAQGHDDFVAGCLEALSETAAERRHRTLAMMASVSRSSWDHTATTVVRSIEAVLAEKGDAPATAPRVAAGVAAGAGGGGYRARPGGEAALATGPVAAGGAA